MTRIWKQEAKTTESYPKKNAEDDMKNERGRTSPRRKRDSVIDSRRKTQYCKEMIKISYAKAK